MIPSLKFSTEAYKDLTIVELRRQEHEERKSKRGRRAYHLYLKKNPSTGADSGRSSVVREPSRRRTSTYGVSSQPTIGISDGRCTRSTLSMLPNPRFPHQSPRALTLTLEKP